ncbi:MAG TPA: matrixin family metalloprotease, partial [Deltaproteobacteria bacterium]|nr:matrixin family metalloprotease [Deltaproteobacteria bacterium]
VHSDSNSVATDSQESAFQSGANAWATTLSELGITISYVTSSPDVKVKWLTSSEMASQAGSSDVLGYAEWDTDKYIYMRTDLSSSTLDFVAIHEFGHMLGIWNHSYDSNDIMYPYATGPTALSNRDKRTLADFLYPMTPTADMHDLSGPSLVDPVTGAKTPHIKTYYTTNGCVIQS